MEENEEQEDTEEHDEEKMKTSDEVEYAVVMIVLSLHIRLVLPKRFKHHLTSCQSPTGHSWTRSNSVWGNVIPGQLHPAQQIHLFWQCQKYVFIKKQTQMNESKSVWDVRFFLTIFSSFTEKNKSYVISSFVETKGETMISKTAVEFVEYPLRCCSKIR